MNFSDANPSEARSKGSSKNLEDKNWTWREEFAKHGFMIGGLIFLLLTMYCSKFFVWGGMICWFLGGGMFGVEYMVEERDS